MELSSESVLCLGLFVTLVSGVLMMICGVQICLHMWLMMIRLCSFSGKAGKESAGREKLHGAIECVVVLLQVQQLSTRWWTYEGECSVMNSKLYHTHWNTVNHTHWNTVTTAMTTTTATSTKSSAAATATAPSDTTMATTMTTAVPDNLNYTYSENYSRGERMKGKKKGGGGCCITTLLLL